VTDHRIHANVRIGEGAVIGDYVIIGVPPRGKKEGELSTLIGRNAVIRSHTVIYAGNEIGDGFQTGHGAMIRECNKIGNGVSVGTNTVIEGGSRIGDGARLHSNVFVSEYTEIGKNAWVGPNAVFTNAPHPLCPKAKECMKGAVVEEGAKIGANCTLLPFIKVGKNSLVGAGSVVTKDVPEGKVAYGNPAVVRKDVKSLECSRHIIDKPY
jgi:acetyltransferase-like isoleucine patch superfamily enzyme